nr:hypothetical protein [Sphingomonas sp. Y57]
MADDLKAVDEDEFATWLRPDETIELLTRQLDITAAYALIRNQLISGKLRSAATVAIFSFEVGKSSSTDRCPIPSVMWETYPAEDMQIMCATGEARTESHQGGRASIHGLKFCRSDVIEMLAYFQPAATTNVPEIRPSRLSNSRRTGRPVNAWWEDLLIEMCRQLYAGDLKPFRQADIEKSMSEWIALEGYSASETAVRTRARKLFHAIHGEN